MGNRFSPAPQLGQLASILSHNRDMELQAQEQEQQRQWQEEQREAEWKHQEDMIKADRTYTAEQDRQDREREAAGYGATIPYFEGQGLLPQGSAQWYGEQPLDAQLGLGQTFSPMLEQRSNVEYGRGLEREDTEANLRGQAIAASYIDKFGWDGAGTAFMDAIDSGQYSVEELAGMADAAGPEIVQQMSPMYQFQLMGAQLGIELTQAQISKLLSSGSGNGPAGGTGDWTPDWDPQTGRVFRNGTTGETLTSEEYESMRLQEAAQADLMAKLTEFNEYMGASGEQGMTQYPDWFYALPEEQQASFLKLYMEGFSE